MVVLRSVKFNQNGNAMDSQVNALWFVVIVSSIWENSAMMEMLLMTMVVATCAKDKLN